MQRNRWVAIAPFEFLTPAAPRAMDGEKQGFQHCNEDQGGRTICRLLRAVQCLVTAE
jgi:hypothetical protein